MRFLGKYKALMSNKASVPIPTLALDFVNESYQYNNVKYSAPNTIAGYNFTNITGGSAYNPKTGLIQYFGPNVPRITSNGVLMEQAGSNLCLSSQALKTVEIWSNTLNGTLNDNVTLSPDGTSTGASFVATSSGAEFRSTAITVTTNTTYTLSFWVKLGTGALNNTQIKITNSSGIVLGTNVTLSGATSTGWTRVVHTVNVGSNTSVFLYPVTQTPQGGTYYIWGVQFELGSIATSYIPTYYGSNTNIIQQSNYMGSSPWYTQGGCTATNNSAIAPDGSLTATRITVTTNQAGVYPILTLPANTTYTLSFYVKYGTATSGSCAIYDFTHDVRIAGITNYPSTVNKDTWTRVSVTFTTHATEASTTGIYIYTNNPSLGTLFFWGVQLQVGNTATKYIPVSPAVTNYALQSSAIASWTPAGTSNSQNSTIAPDGTITGGTVATIVTGYSNSFLTAAYNTVAGTVVTLSCYMKPNSSNFGFLNVGSEPNYSTIIANFASGTITQTANGGTLNIIASSIVAENNGYYRIGITIMPNSSIASTIRVGASSVGVNTLSAVGVPFSSAGNSIYLWGVQLEIGYGPNQLVQTAGSIVSRPAQITATAASPSSFNRTADTFYFDSQLGLNASNTKTLIASGSFLNYVTNVNALASFYDFASSSLINLGSILNGNGNFCAQLIVNGSLVKNLYQVSPVRPATSIRKAGMSFGDNKLAVSQNGVSVVDPLLEDGKFSGTLGISNLYIGFSQNQTPGAINGNIREIKLFNSSLNQNQLNTLTTL
jgi:hypothetical protein